MKKPIIETPPPPIRTERPAKPKPFKSKDVFNDILSHFKVVDRESPYEFLNEMAEKRTPSTSLFSKDVC